MKKLFVSLVVCCMASVALSAQETDRKLALNLSAETGLLPNVSYESFSLTVEKNIAPRLDFVAGLSYWLWEQGHDDTPSDDKDRGDGLMVPLLLRYHFWKYFFLDGGVQTTFKIQDALINIGLGAERYIGSHVKLSVRASYGVSIPQLGVGVGIGYRF